MFVFLTETFSLIYILIAFIVSVHFIKNYYKTKKREIFLAGIALLGLPSPWIPAAITFLVFLLTNGTLNTELYLNSTILLVLFATAFSSLAVLAWAMIIPYFLNIKFSRKLISSIVLILVIVFDILLFYFFFNDLDMIGIFNGPFDYQWGLFLTIYYILIISYVLITGILFAREALSSDNPEIKLKGKLLLLAVISFAVGAFLPFILYSLPGTTGDCGWDGLWHAQAVGRAQTHL